MASSEEKMVDFFNQLMETFILKGDERFVEFYFESTSSFPQTGEGLDVC